MSEAKAGDVLTRETAEPDMICTDLHGHKVVIQWYEDHKTCEVLDWNDYTQKYHWNGNTARYDELTFTGEMYELPPTIIIPGR